MTENAMIQEALLALEGDNVNARASAIETLAEEGYTPAVPQIVKILLDADPGTTFIAAKALGRLADQQAVPALLDTLRGNDIWVRAAVTGALIQIGTPAIEGLTDALRDEDKAVRRAAAKALGKIGELGDDDRVQRGLSSALLDVDDGVRRFAAEALGRLKATSMVSELTEALDDQNAEVRIAAFKALANFKTPEAQKAVRQWVRE
ncbi:MAG: hypothetical protein OHK0046_19320 [Anaerolineae bacterium]